MTDFTSGQQVRAFFELEAEVLDRRFQTIETLLPAQNRNGSAHNGEEGRHIESLLRDFLNRHLPSELRAFSGFILRPATKTGVSDLHRVLEHDRHSKQLDIIVYDRSRYPVYEQFEEFAIVPPEGVIGILSVKKRLYQNQLHAELASLRDAAELCDLPENDRGPHIGLFAFRADMNRTNVKWDKEIIKAIQEEMGGRTFNYLVNEVTIFDQFVVFKWSPQNPPSDKAKFVRCDVQGTKKHVAVQRVIQSLMSVYYGRMDKKRPGFVSFHKGSFRDAPHLDYVPCVHSHK